MRLPFFDLLSQRLFILYLLRFSIPQVRTISSPQWGALRSCRFIVPMGLSALVSEPSSHCCDAWLRIPLLAGFPKFTKFSFGHYYPTDHLHSQLVGLVFTMASVSDHLIGSTGLIYVLTYLGVIPQSRWKYPGGSSNAIVTFYFTIHRTCGNRIDLPFEEGIVNGLL